MRKIRVLKEVICLYKKGEIPLSNQLSLVEDLLYGQFSGGGGCVYYTCTTPVVGFWYKGPINDMLPETQPVNILLYPFLIWFLSKNTLYNGSARIASLSSQPPILYFWGPHVTSFFLPVNHKVFDIIFIWTIKHVIWYD